MSDVLKQRTSLPDLSIKRGTLKKSLTSSSGDRKGNPLAASLPDIGPKSDRSYKRSKTINTDKQNINPNSNSSGSVECGASTSSSSSSSSTRRVSKRTKTTRSSVKITIPKNRDAYTIYKDGILNYRKSEYIKDSHDTQYCFVCDHYAIYKNMSRFIAATEVDPDYLSTPLYTVYREVNLCQKCSFVQGFSCISATSTTLLTARALSFFMPL